MRLSVHSSAAIFIVAVSICLSAHAMTPSRYHAARCIKNPSFCTIQNSKKTGFLCKTQTLSLKQPLKCRKLACKWCDQPKYADKPLCSTAPLKWMCRKLRSLPSPLPSVTMVPTLPSPTKNPSKPSKSPKPSRKPNKTSKPTASSTPIYSRPPSATGPPNIRPCPKYRNTVPAGCVWQPRGKEIVVDVGKLPFFPTGWTCIARGKWVGMIYEKKKNLGIDWKGARGKFCVKIKAPMTGKYYFSALSYAPHNTEHNDMWVNSPDKGFELWQKNVMWKKTGTKEWLKAYQNNGIRGLIDQLKTKDFDGHRFIIPDVKKDEIFRVCVSGRSYKYELYRLFIIKCTGAVCTGRPIYGLNDRPSSICKR